MTAIDIARPRIQTEEGYRAQRYVDTTGHETIGYGFNVEAGISRVAASALLVAQLQEIDDELQAYPWYEIDPPRQSVLLDIAFNAGLPGLLHFPNMLAAVSAKDWNTAAAELLNSLAARQLPNRYGPLAKILQTGQP